MLSYEWRELETLCERVTDLRERYDRAFRSKHMGLVSSIKDELDAIQRQRELVVQHISARLGIHAAGGPEDDSPISRARRRRLAGKDDDTQPTPAPEIVSFDDGGAA